MTNTTPAEPGRRALRIRVLRETLHRLTTTETGDSPTEDLPAATVRRVLTEMLADMTPSPDTDTPTTPAPVDPALRERVADALPDEMPTTPAPVGPTPTWATLVEATAALPPAPPGPHPDSSLRARVAAALLARIKLAVVKPEPLWPGQIGSLLAATEYDLADVVLAELAPELARARQIEELLDIAHETSNRSEAERAHAVERAEQAETALTEAAARMEARAAALSEGLDKVAIFVGKARQAEARVWLEAAAELRTTLTALTGPAEETP